MQTYLASLASLADEVPTENLTFTAKHAVEQIARVAQDKARKSDRDDPAEAVLKAYVVMDKEMLKIVDEHIERVRRSSERNKDIFRKLSIKKEAEKRARQREEYFDESSENADEQRRVTALADAVRKCRLNLLQRSPKVD